jgi:hypothetical protein
MPARLPDIPPAITAECSELPFGLINREPCPSPLLPATAPADELAAVVEVVDVVSLTAEVDTCCGGLDSAGTVRVLVM